jgi:hypothetical protein
VRRGSEPVDAALNQHEHTDGRNRLTPDVVCVFSAGRVIEPVMYTDSVCGTARGLQYGLPWSEPNSEGVIGSRYDPKCVALSTI